jgi:hypothetical protein
MADTKLQKIYDKAIASIAVFIMASTATFLWDLSKSLTVLNQQVAVVIEQVAGNEKNVQLQINVHDKQIIDQNRKVEELTDQMRILNSRMIYITSYINDQRKDHQ